MERLRVTDSKTINNCRDKVLHFVSQGVRTVLSLCGGVLLLMGMLQCPRAGAQEFRGTISGTVKDSSGALVPQASVVARETSTGTVSRTTTNAAGQYVIPFLLPGTYTLTATAKGFERIVHPGIILQSQDHPIINLSLRPGEVSQTVTVKATTPLLNMANASIGAVINTKSVADLPLNGRTPTTLAELAPGVITTGPPQLIHPFDNNAGNEWSIGGTPNQVSEVLLDGAPDLTELGALAYAPTEDSVKEVSIRPFDTDASFGHTIGGVINQVTKSGTNNLHGTLYEFGQISGIDANTYFNDRSHKPLPVFHYNQYGLTVGGPVWIPRVYNGRNKLFFFFAWEGLKDSSPNTQLMTVPTAAEKAGNFAQTLAADSSNQLYNPFTSTVNGKNVSRTAIPGNDLAAAGLTLNPIALNFMKLFPAPNNTVGAKPDGEDNYISNAPSTDSYNNEFGRLDYNVNSRDHVFFDFRHNIRAQTKEDYFGNGATGTTLDRENFGSTLDNVFTLNPTTFFDTRLNWVYFDEVHTSPSVKYTPTAMGLPSYMQSNSTLPQLPFINFGYASCGSHTGFQCLGNNGAAMDPTTSYQFFTDMVKVIGRHTLKIGFDGRRYLMSVQNFGASSGSFEFNSSWVNSGTVNGVSKIFGGDLAAFLLGLPSNGSSSSGTGSQYDINARGDYHQYYIGTFVQDDWRVNSRLSINAGLRFDIDTPFTEKLGRTVNGFNPTATVNYVAQPTFSGASGSAPDGTTYTVSSINTRGGLTYPSPGDGAVYKTNSGFLSPRFGFSYGITKNTVVRGGFGIFVMPETLATLAATGGYSSNALSNQEGFSQTTQLDATNDNYHTPSSNNILANPYPGGLLKPVGSSMGATTFLGEGINFLAPVQHDSYSERWDIGVQQQLTANTMLEAIYVGNHALHLPIATQDLNAIKRQYMSTAPWLNPDMQAAYGQSVSNPFQGTFPTVNGVVNSASMNKDSKVSLASLMVPYPQFGAINEENQTRGQSWFDSAILYLQHRTSHGLTLTANYSFSKLIEQDTFLNNEDLIPERRISPFDHTHHFAAGATYDLPFGKGRMFSLGGGRLAQELAGGWVINGIFQYQSGAPLEFPTDIPLQPGTTLRDIKLNARDTSGSIPALSPVFVTGKSTSCPTTGACNGTSFVNGQYYAHLRTLPQTMSWVRSDGYNNLDASVLKNFDFSEGRYFQLRFESFNTLNHPIFNPPNVSSPTSSTFGYITAATKNSLPRQFQIGGRIVF